MSLHKNTPKLTKELYQTIERKYRKTLKQRNSVQMILTAVLLHLLNITPLSAKCNYF